jgi:phosphohistidine phosphatase
MKTIIFIRHAKSDWSNLFVRDFDRGLNERGMRDAPIMGEVLAKKNLRPERIISSPALRAKLTATTIASYLPYPENQIIYDPTLYGGDITSVVELIASTPQNIHTLILVGHNPELTECVNYFCKSEIENVPTCGVVAMQLKDDDWNSIGKESAQLLYFEKPKDYRLH